MDVCIRCQCILITDEERLRGVCSTCPMLKRVGRTPEAQQDIDRSYAMETAAVEICTRHLGEEAIQQIAALQVTRDNAKWYVVVAWYRAAYTFLVFGNRVARVSYCRWKANTSEFERLCSLSPEEREQWLQERDQASWEPQPGLLTSPLPV